MLTPSFLSGCWRTLHATWHATDLVATIGATVRTLPTNLESNAQGSRPLELHESEPEGVANTATMALLN